MRVLVTGAASGIGRATCLRLARDAQEPGRDGIRVNSVSPGMVRTGMTAKVYADQRVAAGAVADHPELM